MVKSEKKVCFVILWFGERPFWLEYFLKTLACNMNINFLFITDLSINEKIPENIRIIKSSLLDLNTQFSNKLQFETSIDNPYKLCDFKPAYGFLFEDLLFNYDYWGYCDLDLIFGDIWAFIAEPINLNYDIITFDNTFIPGHFCILRNDKSINTLFLKASNYSHVFKSRKSFYFDEFILEKGQDLEGHRKIKLQFKRMRKHRVKQIIIRNLNWLKPFYKKFKCGNKDIKMVDFNTIVNYHVSKGSVRVYQKKHYLSDIDFYNNKIDKWKLLWDNGELKYNTEELLYFHFQISKGSSNLEFIDLAKNSFILQKR